MLTSLIATVLITSTSFLAYTTNPVSSDGAKLREMKRQAITERLDSTSSADIKREQFQARLSEIKDERKRLIVQNVSLRFTNVKDKWVRHWEKTLDRLSTILEKIETEFGDSEAITEAEEAIAEAQALVDALEAKTYEVDFESEDTLRPYMKDLIGQFKEDLKTTQAAIKNAKNKVQEAWRTVKGETGDEE